MCQIQIVAGLRFLLIGDGSGADFKVALGRIKLLRDGPLLRLNRRQIILRRKYVEVGLRHPNHQILARLFQLRFEHRDLQAALFEHLNILLAVQRVGQRHAKRLTVEFAPRCQVTFGALARIAGVQIDRWQQAATCLQYPFAGRFQCRFRAGHQRVMLDGVTIGGDQISGRSRLSY